MAKWRAVEGYEDRYEVSDDGRVRSLPNSRFKTVRELRQTCPEGRYPFVTLFSHGKAETAHVHRLVAAAFCGTPKPGDEVCHHNGDKKDNRKENLRWDSRSANIRDNVRNGTHSKSSRTQCPQGHPYTPENLRKRARWRDCLICHRLRERARRDARRIYPESS